MPTRTLSVKHIITVYVFMPIIVLIFVDIYEAHFAIFDPAGKPYIWVRKAERKPWEVEGLENWQ